MKVDLLDVCVDDVLFFVNLCGIGGGGGGGGGVNTFALLQRVWSKKTMSNRQSFTPPVEDSDSHSDSEHFDEESRDCLLSHSHENQPEDDSESTDDGFD